MINRVLAISVATTVLSFALTAAALAGVIPACVQQPTGLTRIVSDHAECLPTEIPISLAAAIEGNAPVVSTASPTEIMVIASAYIGPTGQVLQQDGDWIQSVTHTTGRYTLNLEPGLFGSPPNCTATVQASMRLSTRFALPSTTSTVSLEIIDSGFGSFNDSPFYMICTGPSL